MLLRLRISVVALILTLSFLSITAQKLKKTDKVTQDNLETHIRYLSDDKLEGRRTGTPGEKSAADYISSAFSQAGLQPKGDHNGWLQAFTIDEGRQVSADAYFSVNDRPFLLNKDYFPLAFSAPGVLSGSPAIALQESGEPWFLDLKELLESNSGNPHFDLAGAIRARVAAASKKGATALILYNSSSKLADKLAYNTRERPEPVAIPVVYITKEAKRKYLKDESASLEIKGKVGFTEKSRTGHNVVGYVDNGAANTVVIGAHYDYGGDHGSEHGGDHGGRHSEENGGEHSGGLTANGEDSGSQHRGPVYNGADDNASGVAAAIELARLLKDSRFWNNNYLFVAFSGEEQGLYGSGYFVEHPPIDLAKVNYMINMDQVGRLSDSSHLLVVGGYGSSPVWGAVCSRVVDKKLLSLRFDSSGNGSGDHRSFYRKGIPVLLFCTGGSSVHHGPADGNDKINYTGELQVVKFIYSVVQNMNSMGRIAFTKAGEARPGL
jgi:aminopeptidase YwaD